MHVDTQSQPIKLIEYRRSRLVVTAGPDAGKSLTLAGREIRVGTELTNDLVLTDPRVSRTHCSVQPTTQGLIIRDDSSRNGVFISGLRVRDALATSAPVVLMLGDTELCISPLSELERREQLSTDRIGDLLGKAPPMQELFADIQRIAATDVSTLIEGETGTGKELVAEALHRLSARANGPFVVFDCGAVAANLIESEIFGHVAGAFTGASTNRAGLFQEADGGTIFLDEIGELPKDMQPKLLRVLEKGDVRRIGASRTETVDVRVVAATNRNLQEEVARGSFREDLFFRVAGAQVFVPPLRARMEDLPLLVEHFLEREVPRRSLSDIPPHVWEMFRKHRWPGNVRELRNATSRLRFAPDAPLPPTRLTACPPLPQDIPPLQQARREATDVFERAYLHAVLAQAKHNVTRAAALAAISRQMMQRLMRKHGM